MPLGTLDRNPPPFFHQGPSALTRVLICGALSIFLMAADHRFTLIAPLRNALATALLPVVRVVGFPVNVFNSGADYAAGLNQALARNEALQKELTAQAELQANVARLVVENTQLRALLNLRPHLPMRTQAAEVLYEAPDPYSHKIFIDRGSEHGVLLGSPVVTASGVLGQVTQVYLLSAEVTLLADRDASIPVLNPRTQRRSAAFGTGDDGVMELRFVSPADDVKVGDLLTTSGIDGIYPSGLPVARVTSVDRHGDGGFARITLTPAATAGDVHHVLLLDPLSAHEAPLAAAAAAASAAASAASAAASKGIPDAHTRRTKP